MNIMYIASYLAILYIVGKCGKTKINERLYKAMPQRLLSNRKHRKGNELFLALNSSLHHSAATFP